MRALVDLPDVQVQALDELARQRRRSRAALIREAVEDYLGRHGPRNDDEAFGLWAGDFLDGLAFQERARREW